MIAIQNVSNAQDGLNSFARIKSCKPFQYSGTWFCSLIGTEFLCYRTKKALVSQAAKRGESSIDVYTIRPQK